MPGACAAARAGGSTLVDLTLEEIGRDPAALRRVAEASGVTIIMGCGHYRDPYLNRDWFDRHAVDAIADEIVADIEEGSERHRNPAGHHRRDRRR